MIDQQITAAFTAALSKWVTAAALHLDQERMELLGLSLEADDMDVRDCRPLVSALTWCQTVSLRRYRARACALTKCQGIR